MTTARPTAVVAPVHPLVSAAAPFNTAMVAALAERGPVRTLSWRRLYPPLLHGRDAVDRASTSALTVDADFGLDWANPATWRRAVRAVADSGAGSVVIPWLHPVMAPPYRYLLRHMPRDVVRTVVCHNVTPHEPVPFGRRLTRSVLRHADLLVTHAPHQRGELAALGLGATPVLESFHPQLGTGDAAVVVDAGATRALRAELGDPDLLLLSFGAVRPYKGLDLALEALALLEDAVDVRLVIAGVFWKGTGELREHARRLGVEHRVVLRDEYVSNDDAALLFGAADASLLPYRSASQSGVVALSFGHGTPVIATAVGGLPAAVAHGTDGLLCRPEDPASIADAIRTLSARRTALAAGVRTGAQDRSFERYAADLEGAIEAVRAAGLSTAPRRARPRLAADAV